VLCADLTPTLASETEAEAEDDERAGQRK
jgi:hypothetical protein